MELLQLKYFLILCESQHVSKSAEKLNISQPSLSSTIKKLEKEQMIAAVRAMQTHFTPLKGKIVRLGLAQTNPHRDICTVDLK